MSTRTPPTTPRKSRSRNSNSTHFNNSPLRLSNTNRPSTTLLTKTTSNIPNLKPYLALIFALIALFGPISQAISVQRYFSLPRDFFDLNSLSNSSSNSSNKTSHKSTHHRINKSDSSFLNSTFVSIAKSAALTSQRASWEQGTLANALLELDSSSWTGFSKNQYQEGPPFDILRFGVRAVVNQDSIGRLSSRVTGDESTSQGAALDSSSSGPIVLLAAKSNNSLAIFNGRNAPGGSWGMLMKGAKHQYDYLTQKAPKSNSGFISQRANGVQAWADSAYMGPPFLASYGELTKNQAILTEGYNLMSLLRGYMKKNSKLWAHIFDVDSNRFQASGSWNTGQGWALYGMIRVLTSIHQSDFSSQMNSQKKDLINWSNELLDSLIPFVDSSSGLFHNYIDQSNTFLDGSGSMLIAASIYRLASILPSSATKASNYISVADKIYSKTSSSLDQFGLFTNGVQVVSVLGFDDPGFASVEGLAFGIMMHSSKRDFMAGNCTTVKVN